MKVAIICSSAGQNDNGYNQSAVKGAKKAAEELGIEYKVVEPTTGVPQALESLADDGYNVIFNLEYDFEALIQEQEAQLRLQKCIRKPLLSV